MRGTSIAALAVAVAVHSSAHAPPPATRTAAFAPPPPDARLLLRVGAGCTRRAGAAARRSSAGGHGEPEGGPRFHEVPPGAPGAPDMWRGIPLDRRRLAEERARSRSERGPPGKRDAAETFFSSTYRGGAGPRRDEEWERDTPVHRAPPRLRSGEQRRSLRPTTRADRPGASRVVDGLRAPARSFFDDPRSLDPRRAAAARPQAPPGAGFPPGYSAPLSGFNAPLSSSRAAAAAPPPAANPFGARERASPAARRPAPSPPPPSTGLRAPVGSAPSSGSGSRSGGPTGSAARGGSSATAASSDPLEGEQLVGSLKGGETVVHAMHGVCRFKAIERTKVGHLMQAYLVLEFADGTLREQVSKAPTMLTRYLGSGSGYRKRKKEVSGATGAEDEEDADAELEEAGPALDYLSRPEVWKKRKSKARRAIRKLATDVVKLQALRGSKQRPTYPRTDGGELRQHVRAEEVGEETAAAGRGHSPEDLDEARTEMLAMGFDSDTVERALRLPAEHRTTTARAVAADLQATGGTMTRRAAFEAGFPFTLTSDQAQAIADIEEDMCAHATPMDRLVCGDVGFGKTEVALRAMLTSVLAGRQSILLAPTTVLAAQHFRKVEERFRPIGFRVALLSRYTPPKEKKAIIARIASGEVDMVVGTHALLAPQIAFSDLGLVVVDEEQRFGVNQKEKLKAMAVGVDVLTLSATPIPRTLQMAMSGLREMSTILTPPPMRRQIVTKVAPAEEEVVREALLRELARGGQAYCVVPRIADTEAVAALVRRLSRVGCRVSGVRCTVYSVRFRI